MNYRDEILKSREDFKTVPMPLALYCAFSNCQTLIRPGEPANRYDGATYTHISCPKTPIRHFAPHKQPDSGMVIGCE